MCTKRRTNDADANVNASPAHLMEEGREDERLHRHELDEDVQAVAAAPPRAVRE
jgi:hypothetical protein